MEVSATTKYVRMSSSKVRDLARAITGLPVAKALEILDFSERKGARNLAKTLKSAIANAENNAELDVDDLSVKEASIGGGPRMKRYWPRARGMVSPVIKRMCHMRVVLTDGKKDEDA